MAQAVKKCSFINADEAKIYIFYVFLPVIFLRPLGILGRVTWFSVISLNLLTKASKKGRKRYSEQPIRFLLLFTLL